MSGRLMAFLIILIIIFALMIIFFIHLILAYRRHNWKRSILPFLMLVALISPCLAVTIVPLDKPEKPIVSLVPEIAQTAQTVIIDLNGLDGLDFLNRCTACPHDNFDFNLSQFDLNLTMNFTRLA